MNSYMHSKEPHEILPTKASDCYVVVGLYHVKSLRTGPKILVSHGEAIPLHAHLTTNNLVFAVLGVFIAVIVQFFLLGIGWSFCPTGYSWHQHTNTGPNSSGAHASAPCLPSWFG